LNKDVYGRKVSGLLGNYDGDRNNDLKLRSGKITNNITEFCNSWQVKDSCKSSLKKYAPTKEDIKFGRSQCDAIEHEAFKKCIPPTKKLIQYCIHDVILVRKFPEQVSEVVCTFIDRYVEENCKAPGEAIANWHNIIPGCHAKCPNPNEIYKECGNPCLFTCSFEPGCISSCVQGCACKDGYRKKDNKCVPISQCEK